MRLLERPNLTEAEESIVNLYWIHPRAICINYDPLTRSAFRHSLVKIFYWLFVQVRNEKESKFHAVSKCTGRLTPPIVALCTVGPHRKKEDSQQCWPSDDDIIAHIFRHRIGSDHTEWNLSRGMRMSSQKSPRTLEYADVATISAAKNGCDASDLLENQGRGWGFAINY